MRYAIVPAPEIPAPRRRHACLPRRDGRKRRDDRSEIDRWEVAAATRTKVMKKVALTEIKDQLSKYLRIAERDDVVITALDSKMSRN